MIFYLMFYPVKQYAANHIGWCMCVVFALCYIAFFFVNKNDADMMYRWTWSMYFLPMLMGAMLGRKNKGNTAVNGQPKLWIILSGLLICAAGYYVVMHISRTGARLEILRPFVILPQLGVTYFFYVLCRSVYAAHLLKNRRVYSAVMFVGSLCLEIYLVQPRIIREFAMPHMFPLNIVFVVAVILLSAYCLKCLGRLWEQTFKESLYEWKEIFKPY